VALLDKPAELRHALLDHVTEETAALRRRVVEWDVVNEPFSNFDVQTALTGIPHTAANAPEKHAAILAEFFRAARDADPGVKLDINDYSILETGGKDVAHQDHYERTIRALLAAHAPLNGIGIQGHFSEDLTPIPRLWEILDRFGATGLPIQITEFDVNTADEALQADYTRDFLTAMFANEHVIGVLNWGFWEKRHWLPNAAFYRADWSLRPAGQVWQELVKKKWWTDADGVTGADGVFHARGFAGDYDVTIANSWKTTTLNVTLRPEGTAVSAELPR
jgi:GH35 family endo-1,4-beta-xylanase